MNTEIRTGHPLELIAFFRRWPQSAARDALYTGIWNCLLAVVLTIAGRMFSDSRDASFLRDLLPTLIMSNLIGYLIHGTLSALDLLLRGWPKRARGVARVLYYVSTISACVVAGIVLGSALLRGASPAALMVSGSALVPLLMFAMLVAALMMVVFVLGERRIDGELLAARQSEQLAAAAQLLAETRLRALQTQIEPHFLYNTLANVVSLIDSQPAQARTMLERFIDYLRASLAASRADQATLGAELDLVAAYLDVLAVRMGHRLRYRIEADDACRALPMMPMLLQPLVENAVTHGLEPTIEGGEITVRARIADGKLWLEVADSGVGLGNAAPKPGGGVGLSNLRARLRSVYAGEAQLQLLENQPCGIMTRMMIPLKETPILTTFAS